MPSPKRKKAKYAADRGLPGAYEGETVTRRRFMELNALTAGGIASAAFGLPALGFAAGPLFTESSDEGLQDVGAVGEFNADTYVPRIITLIENTGEAGKHTVYIRRRNPKRDNADRTDDPFIALSNRCMHVGCPIRYVQASEKFICPCHGGVYDFDGKVQGGPPVRPLDRFTTKVEGGRVLVGERYSVNSRLEKQKVRDPSNHLDGLWKYLYPPRPTV
jgi:Rieske Fe-S protein